MKIGPLRWTAKDAHFTTLLVNDIRTGYKLERRGAYHIRGLTC